MKVIRLFFTSLALVTIASASAQFSNAPATQGSYNTNQSTTSTATVRTRPERNDDLAVSKIFASYDVPNFKSQDVDKYSNLTGSGFSIGYLRSIPVSGIDLTIDMAGIFSYAKCTSEKGEYSKTLYDGGEKYYDDNFEYSSFVKYSYINIPVSVAYHIKVSDKFSIVPYSGLNVRVGLACKDELKYEGSTYEGGEMTYDYDDLNASIDCFDKDDMVKNEYTRFSLGYQIGFDLEFKMFYMGFNYTQDFTELNDCYKYRSSSIRVGVKF